MAFEPKEYQAGSELTSSDLNAMNAQIVANAANVETTYQKIEAASELLAANTEADAAVKAEVDANAANIATLQQTTADQAATDEEHDRRITEVADNLQTFSEEASGRMSGIEQRFSTADTQLRASIDANAAGISSLNQTIGHTTSELYRVKEDHTSKLASLASRDDELARDVDTNRRSIDSVKEAAEQTALDLSNTRHEHSEELKYLRERSDALTEQQRQLSELLNVNSDNDGEVTRIVSNLSSDVGEAQENISANATKIQNLTDKVTQNHDAMQQSVSSLDSKIDTSVAELREQLAANAEADSATSDSVKANRASITALEAADTKFQEALAANAASDSKNRTELEQLIAANTTAINNFKAEALEKIEQANEDITTIQDAIPQIETNKTGLAELKNNVDNTLTPKVTKLEGDVATATGDISTLKTAVETTLPGSIAEAKKAGDDAAQNVTTLTATVTKQGNTLTELKDTTVANLSTKVTAVEQTANAAKSTADGLDTRVTSAEEKATQATTKVGELTTKVTGAETAVNDMKSQVAKIGPLETKVNKVDEFQPKVDKIDGLEAKVSGMEPKVNKIATMEPEVQKIATMETEVAKISNLESEVGKIANMESKVNKIDAIEAKANKTDTLEQQYNDMSAKVTELEKLQQKITELEGRIAALESPGP